MDYCNSYNSMMYHHSQQHEYRCGMMKMGYNNNNNTNTNNNTSTNNNNNSYSNMYGHNQHISWNGMHHHQYASNRNVSTACHYDSYKANIAAQQHQPSYATNFETPYEPLAGATVPPPPSPVYRSRFNGYQMCDFPMNGAGGPPGIGISGVGNDNNHGEYPTVNGNMSRCLVNGNMSRCLDPNGNMSRCLVNGNMSRCLDPLTNHHHHHLHQQQQQPYEHSPVPHHSSNHSMRIPSNYRAYDSHHSKPQRPYDGEPQYTNWYGHHHGQTYQSPHIHNTAGNQYAPSAAALYGQPPIGSISPNSIYGAQPGQLVTAKEDKAPKMHRDRSLSKLVAMNRRLETQMSEHERNDALHHDHFENFDYYTDYSETPDSITSSSQFTNNDCMMNNINETDNNNNINGTHENSHKSDCKENNNQQVTSDSAWLTTISTASATATVSESLAATPSTEITTTTTTTTTSPPLSSSIDTSSLKNDAKCIDSNADSLNSKPSLLNDENAIKKSDLPSHTNSPAKQTINKKIVRSKKMNNEHSVEKRRKRREKKSNADLNKTKELKTDTIPLPGFQQAFGSTEIGRFSEIFFNASGSPIEIGLFESEADTSSPQPWEMGDSLEGPHFSMQANNTPLSYTESLGSTDSPTASNNSFFSELRASEF